MFIILCHKCKQIQPQSQLHKQGGKVHFLPNSVCHVYFIEIWGVDGEGGEGLKEGWEGGGAGVGGGRLKGEERGRYIV